MMHKVTIDGHENTEEFMNFYKLKKSMYEPGEKVTFSVHTATDTSYKVTSAQVSIRSEGYEPGGLSNYSFVMPDTDVEIEITSRSTMVNPYMNGAPVPSMGMMGIVTAGMMESLNAGMMGMSIPANTDSTNDPDPYLWEGKPKFCAECGAPTKGSNKFCRECGAPLNPKK